MESHPIIYVSRITNLSDARYCAGMGADMLGFVVDPVHRDYVSPEACQELMGWIAGPSRVIEAGQLSADKVLSTAANYAADYLHIPFARLADFSSSSLPRIVEVSYQDAASIMTGKDKGVAYWMVTSVPDEVLPNAFSGKRVLISRTGMEGSVAAMLSHSGASGVALKGSHESAPGLKDYDHLSQILEELNG